MNNYSDEIFFCDLSLIKKSEIVIGDNSNRASSQRANKETF